MSLLMSPGAAAEGPPEGPSRRSGTRGGGAGRRGRALPAAGAEGGGRCLLQNSLDAKDGSGSAHAGIAPAAAYYPYDHTLSQYQYDR